MIDQTVSTRKAREQLWKREGGRGLLVFLLEQREASRPRRLRLRFGLSTDSLDSVAIRPPTSTYALAFRCDARNGDAVSFFAGNG